MSLIGLPPLNPASFPGRAQAEEQGESEVGSGTCQLVMAVMAFSKVKFCLLSMLARTTASVSGQVLPAVGQLEIPL